MGVRKTRNRVAYIAYSSGEEVDQLLVSHSATTHAAPAHDSAVDQQLRGQNIPQPFTLGNEEVHPESVHDGNDSSA
ncbi:hypothetical protein LINPERHAP1_LOCUS19252 [Linum perenne]